MILIISLLYIMLYVIYKVYAKILDIMFYGVLLYATIYSPSCHLYNTITCCVLVHGIVVCSYAQCIYCIYIDI